MRRPIDWGWLLFFVAYCAVGMALLWFALEWGDR